MPTIDPRPTTQDPSDDPYLWLENIEGEAALARWNIKTLARWNAMRVHNLRRIAML